MIENQERKNNLSQILISSCISALTSPDLAYLKKYLNSDQVNAEGIAKSKSFTVIVNLIKSPRVGFFNHRVKSLALLSLLCIEGCIDWSGQYTHEDCDKITLKILGLANEIKEKLPYLSPEEKISRIGNQLTVEDSVNNNDAIFYYNQIKEYVPLDYHATLLEFMDKARSFSWFEQLDKESKEREYFVAISMPFIVASKLGKDIDANNNIADEIFNLINVIIDTSELNVKNICGNKAAESYFVKFLWDTILKLDKTGKAVFLIKTIIYLGLAFFLKLTEKYSSRLILESVPLCYVVDNNSILDGWKSPVVRPDKRLYSLRSYIVEQLKFKIIDDNKRYILSRVLNTILKLDTSPPAKLIIINKNGVIGYERMIPIINRSSELREIKLPEFIREKVSDPLQFEWALEKSKKKDCQIFIDEVDGLIYLNNDTESVGRIKGFLGNQIMDIKSGMEYAIYEKFQKCLLQISDNSSLSDEFSGARNFLKKISDFTYLTVLEFDHSHLTTLILCDKKDESIKTVMVLYNKNMYMQNRGSASKAGSFFYRLINKIRSHDKSIKIMFCDLTYSKYNGEDILLNSRYSYHVYNFIEDIAETAVKDFNSVFLSDHDFVNKSFSGTETFFYSASSGMLTSFNCFLAKYINYNSKLSEVLDKAYSASLKSIGGAKTFELTESEFEEIYNLSEDSICKYIKELSHNEDKLIKVISGSVKYSLDCIDDFL